MKLIQLATNKTTMTNIETFIQSVQKHVKEILECTKPLDPQQLAAAPSGKWNTKEILGHLCDSGIENMVRYHRIAGGDQPFQITQYPQDFLVQNKQYTQQPIGDILNMFQSINTQIVFFMKQLPQNIVHKKVINSDQTESTLQDWLKDYSDHLAHHGKQIKERSSLP